MKEREIRAILTCEEDVNGIIHLEPLRGANGLSAYEIYVRHVPEDETPLTEQEWLDSISKANYYRQYEQTFTTSKDNTTTIPILINAYNETCLLDVYLNGLRLNNKEYSVNNENKTIILANSINKNQVVYIVVRKTIVTSIEGNLPSEPTECIPIIIKRWEGV